MNKERLIEDLCEAIVNLRDKKPLIEQVTNYVTINDCANVTLAIGASPVMGDGFEEVDQMTMISDALVINYGVINGASLKTMIKAGKTANKHNIGIVLDPVGVGATQFRNEAIVDLLTQVHPRIIKGNASEIMSLSGMNTQSKGVDSSADSLEAIDAALKVARDHRCVCAVTGRIDIITDGRYTVKIYNESDLLSYITGTGCMITSLAASFLGGGASPLVSAVGGILAMSIAGEEAAIRENEENNGIASYREDVMNNIYKFNQYSIRDLANIEVEKVEYKYPLYLVTDEKACKGKDFYESVEASIRGGAKIVQLREKNMDTRDFFKRALKLKEICHKHGVDFVINDRLDIAMAVDADGVHLGQSDMPIEKAKEILGHKKIIGISAKNMEEALEAQKYGADYIGVGAIFATDTKKDSGLIDLETLKDMTNQINIPVLAIGGIGLGKLGYLKDTGIDGICVISDILGSDNPEKRTRELLEEYRSIDV
ncbi:hydroxyethylthiazole kinase [Peptostreptococcus stomatis]|uniref:hydroxyethylthiazole kinase n=1 Tax=Peptostreptococcus stomatis TaxID=341694 RepID=UPI0028D7576B|nr:hydroxyethylthiazole kinase [Peptostreptococcus stomatis]